MATSHKGMPAARVLAGGISRHAFAQATQSDDYDYETRDERSTPEHTERQAIPTTQETPMFCVCGHEHADHDMLDSTACDVPECKCTRWGLDDMSGRTVAKSLASQPSPLQRCIDLFDAALAVNGDVTLWQHYTPVALHALTQWAALHHYAVLEIEHDATLTVHRCAPHGDSRADLRVYVRMGVG